MAIGNPAISLFHGWKIHGCNISIHSVALMCPSNETAYIT